jgi:hypothetical protein
VAHAGCICWLSSVFQGDAELEGGTGNALSRDLRREKFLVCGRELHFCLRLGLRLASLISVSDPGSSQLGQIVSPLGRLRLPPESCRLCMYCFSTAEIPLALSCIHRSAKLQVTATLTVQGRALNVIYPLLDSFTFTKRAFVILFRSATSRP